MGGNGKEEEKKVSLLLHMYLKTLGQLLALHMLLL